MFHIENKIKNNKRTYRDTGVSIGIDSRASGAVKGPDLRGLDVDDIPLISLCTKRTQVNDITNQCGAKKKNSSNLSHILRAELLLGSLQLDLKRPVGVNGLDLWPLPIMKKDVFRESPHTQGG